jgi:hypothetical protein
MRTNRRIQHHAPLFRSLSKRRRVANFCIPRMRRVPAIGWLVVVADGVSNGFLVKPNERRWIG